MDINHSYYEDVLNKEKFSYSGLNESKVRSLKEKYGNNTLGEKKKNGLLKKIFKALTEPMILILLFATAITVGINIGNFIAGKESDFYECVGIICAIALSVGLTIFMENKSEKAFETLKKLSDAISVTVFRNNKRVILDYAEVVVGDVVLYETGDKVIADGIIIDCCELEVDESSLSGESISVKKHSFLQGKISSENMLYSGSYLKSGNAKMLVLAVGKNAQIGKIANTLSQENNVTAPLSAKLTALSKKISIFGGVAALLTFILSLIRLYLNSNLNFENIKEAFIQAVVLIVAAVPEGLPATVAIALALSVVKLAKSNAVIKKLVAAETVGCVSVICSDKTGTLTVGKMQVNNFVIDGKEINPQQLTNKFLINNVIYNSTAYFVKDKGILNTFGNSTECALINCLFKNNYKELNSKRGLVEIVKRESFSSKRKYMLTIVKANSKQIAYVKGSIEKIIEFCNFSKAEGDSYLELASKYAKRAERIIAFAHDEGNGFIFDGFCSISDVIRKEVYNAVSECKKAGIEVKILTGDNQETALAIAKKLGIASDFSNIATGAEIEVMSDKELIEKLPRLTVIARSTPEIKLKIVNTLKKMGEIVAVTGDGVNDAPAVKNADIGISMGSGSEITKEASDIILLDNSFSVIVKAVAFGRNIYRNFQRFIFFQLTVNFSAVGIIIAFLAFGFAPPFTALQLLWINIIMDGPLALSLGLERRDEGYMDEKPVRRSDSIITKKTFLRTVLHSIFIISVLIFQKLFNFFNATVEQGESVIFALFVFFQLFNAVNAREIGHVSIIKSLGKNKPFTYLLLFTAIMQILITEYFGKMFSTVSLGLILWGKIFAVTFTLILISEGYKMLYRILKKQKKLKNISKRRKFA
ncbi:MAG: calcium-translocating P-type ATPase, PMCA-type [Clostridiales bacterium]|nr:calcium-translocating P-type ATPase, PMCA-type [Clostridiales bacterium]